MRLRTQLQGITKKCGVLMTTTKISPVIENEYITFRTMLLSIAVQQLSTLSLLIVVVVLYESPMTRSGDMPRSTRQGTHKCRDRISLECQIQWHVMIAVYIDAMTRDPEHNGEDIAYPHKLL